MALIDRPLHEHERDHHRQVKVIRDGDTVTLTMDWHAALQLHTELGVARDRYTVSGDVFVGLHEALQ